MIDIKNIYIDGYKNIDELDMNLAKINALLSANNYGKSNVFSAIEFGFDFITKPSNIKNSMMKRIAEMPLLTVNWGKNFKFEITFDYPVDNNTNSVKYGFELSWQKNAKEQGKIISEYLKIKQLNQSQKYVSYIDRTLNNAKYKSSKTGRCDKDILIKGDELVINKIQAFDDLFYLEIVNAINSLKIFVDRRFDVSELFDEIPFIQKNFDEGSPHDEITLARTLYFLKKNKKSKYELIINTLMDFFPYILDVKIKEFKVSEQNIDVKVDEKGPFEIANSIFVLVVSNKFMPQTVSFKLMSDGAKRMLLLLTHMALIDIKEIPIIGIEEPENSVHPGLFKKYIGIIDGFMEHTKVIITSHSPYLIDYIDLSNLYIGEPTDDGKAVFKNISQNGINKINRYAEEMGIKTGEYLFSIVNGDDFDKELLKKYLEK
ncbi:MAG: AAA family ATPase [Christensenellales bacterium]|jgi:predicted ATPase|nr:ATP-binding protein [Clostridiales bacterium]